MLEILKQLFEFGLDNSIFGFIIVISLIVGTVLGWKKVFTTLGYKSEKELQNEEFKKQLTDLQEQMDTYEEKLNKYQSSIRNKQEEYHEQSIEIRSGLEDRQDALKDQITSLTNMMQAFIKKENETTVAMFRSSLWRLHKDFIAQGYVTPDGLKTFMEMGRVYEDAGGDDIYHDKLKPEIEELEIRYPNGSVYLK